MIEVSVVVVTWNSGRFLPDFLSDIFYWTTSVDFEVIVVDNGSSDNTVEIIGSRLKNIRLKEMNANVGFASAANMGIRMTQGKYVLLLNPDIRLNSDVIRILKEFMDTHSEAGIVGPRIVDQNGNADVYSARNFPTLRNMAFRIFGLRKIFPRSLLFTEETIPSWDRKSLRTVPYLNGAAMMIRRSLIEEIGNLDERIPMYYEDLEYCARTSSHNESVFYTPGATLIHLGGKSSSLSPERGILYAMEDGLAPWLYFKEYRRWPAASIFRGMLLFGNVLRIIGIGVLQSIRRSHSFKVELVRSYALFRWAIMPNSRFSRKVSRLFARLPDTNMSSL